MQGTQIQSLVQELRSHIPQVKILGATTQTQGGQINFLKRLRPTPVLKDLRYSGDSRVFFLCAHFGSCCLEKSDKDLGASVRTQGGKVLWLMADICLGIGAEG